MPKDWPRPRSGAVPHEGIGRVVANPVPGLWSGAARIGKGKNVIRGNGRRAVVMAALSVVLGGPLSVGATAAHAAPGCKRNQCPPADTLAPLVAIANPAS